MAVITLWGMGYWADQMQLAGVLLLKGMAVPVHAVQAYQRSGGITPLILNLGTR